MNNTVLTAKFAFNILLANALNQSIHLIPDDVPYTISHFFTNFSTGLHVSMRDGRTMDLTYETRPNVNIDCFYVNVYFESPLCASPILSVAMNSEMLIAYKYFVDVFVKVSMSMQEHSGVPISELNDNSFQSISHP